MSDAVTLRPFLAADAPVLRDLFAQSIEELTQEDYDEDQRLAWISCAQDAAAFAGRLARATTLVALAEGDIVGFGALADGNKLDMLFVHPFHAGEGVGTALADALERIATARGATEISVDASDTAAPFFEDRGYVAVRRNTVPVDGLWLANTTMTKPLAAKSTPPGPGALQ